MVDFSRRRFLQAVPLTALVAGCSETSDNGGENGQQSDGKLDADRISIRENSVAGLEIDSASLSLPYLKVTIENTGGKVTAIEEYSLRVTAYTSEGYEMVTSEYRGNRENTRIRPGNTREVNILLRTEGDNIAEYGLFLTCPLETPEFPPAYCLEPATTEPTTTPTNTTSGTTTTDS